MTHRRIFSLTAAFGFICALLVTDNTSASAQTPTATVTTFQATSACQTSGCLTTLTATVTAGSVAVHPGMVSFCDKGSVNCENEAPIGRALLTANGTATIKLALAGGPHTLRAVFHGTKTYAGSISTTQNSTTQPIAADRTSQFFEPGVSTVNGVYDFSVYFDAYGPLAPTGTMSFLDTSNNDAVLASGPVSSGTPIPGYTDPYFTYATANADFSRVSTQLVNATRFMTVGDFNNDGMQDIALVDTSTNLTILLGNGSGGFVQAPAYNGNTGALGQPVVGDFNGDGNLDVAIPDAATNTVRVSLGNGDGTFTHAANTTLSDSPQTLYLGDFDGDGIEDLVAISNLSQTTTYPDPAGTSIHVMLGQGDGTFKPLAAISYASHTLTTIAVADFNRDGIQDLAVTYYPAAPYYTLPTTSVALRGNGDGTFASTPVATFAGSNIYLIAGDFDGDGIPDVYGKAPYDSTGNLNFFHGNGDFTFTETSTQEYFSDSYAPLVSADFDGSGTLQVKDQAGPNQYYSSAAAIADFNGDGLPDFFFLDANPAATTVYSSLFEASILRQTAISFKARTLFTPGLHNIVASYTGDAYHTPNVSSVDPFQGPNLDYTNGFLGETGLVFNGAASLSGNTIRLTNGKNFQSGSFFSPKRVSMVTFQSDFDFQLGDGTGDGFAFVLQSNGPNAIGSGAGGLGYGNPPNQTGPGITNSIAIAFDLHNNQGEGSNSIRVEGGGVTMPTGAIDLTPYKVDMHNGHTFHATIYYYDEYGIQVFIQDLQNARKVLLQFALPGQKNFKGLLLGNTAYVGFTGATGGGTGTVTLNNWLFSSSKTSQSDQPYPYGAPPAYPDGFAGATGLGFNGVAALSGPVLQLTNGTKFQATSAYDLYKVFPQAPFNTDFDFQIEKGVGDGFTFVIQGNRLASLGQQGGGLGYGPLLPTIPSNSSNSIPNSLAVKFDLHNDAGEGSDSTGVYVNGASPTTPSVDLGPTGINLQNGHTFHAHLFYSDQDPYAPRGLTLSITDLTTYKNFTTLFPYTQYPQSALPVQAFVGFTAGTGATASSIKILNWDWASFQQP